ncbi:unnamed protein product [Rhizophagus irregularis]|nr:unnamed protein product [Rhizophagus irregularis]CAB5378733.1 unnamed protein product [Rhizophagus irregularis]
MPFLFNSVFHIINDGIPSPNSEILKNYLDAAPLTELYLELKSTIVNQIIIIFFPRYRPTNQKKFVRRSFTCLKRTTYMWCYDYRMIERF